MGTKADQIRALRESTATTGEPMPKAKKAEAVKTAKETVVQATEKSEIKAAEADKAKAENPPPQDDAAKQEKTMLKRATITKTATPTKAKPSTARKSSAKSKASANARKPVEVKAPSGMAEKIGKLASRPNGASRAELIELSGWKQQAWKWYFINSKDNGFCQRFGYKLDVIDGKDGETRYKITKK